MKKHIKQGLRIKIIDWVFAAKTLLYWLILYKGTDMGSKGGCTLDCEHWFWVVTH